MVFAIAMERQRIGWQSKDEGVGQKKDGTHKAAPGKSKHREKKGPFKMCAEPGKGKYGSGDDVQGTSLLLRGESCTFSGSSRHCVCAIQ